MLAGLAGMAFVALGIAGVILLSFMPLIEHKIEVANRPMPQMISCSNGFESPLGISYVSLPNDGTVVYGDYATQSVYKIPDGVACNIHFQKGSR